MMIIYFLRISIEVLMFNYSVLMADNFHPMFLMGKKLLSFLFHPTLQAYIL